MKFAALNLLFKDLEGSRHCIGFPAPQFVYGELETMASYFDLFSNSDNLKQDSFFVDLGSGLGKANILVAACFPVRLSLGIEAVPRLFEISVLQKKIFENELQKLGDFHGKVKFACGMAEDMVENWIFADVVFLNSLTWGKKSIKRMLEALRELKVGAEVITSTKLQSSFLKLKKCIKTKMNWGVIPMYMYEKVSDFSKFSNK